MVKVSSPLRENQTLNIKCTIHIPRTKNRRMTLPRRWLTIRCSWFCEHTTKQSHTNTSMPCPTDWLQSVKTFAEELH
jgi:hypothetical protein